MPLKERAAPHDLEIHLMKGSRLPSVSRFLTATSMTSFSSAPTVNKAKAVRVCYLVSAGRARDFRGVRRAPGKIAGRRQRLWVY